MSAATTLNTSDATLASLTAAGITLDHLPVEVRSRLDDLTADEMQMLIDLKRRFTGELAPDPALYEGSDEY